MSPQLIWDNLVAYSMQIGLLVGLAAFVPAVLRLRLPARGWPTGTSCWSPACCCPPSGPGSQAVDRAVDVQCPRTVAAHRARAVRRPAARFRAPRSRSIVLAAGVLGRLAWLGLGFWRLRRLPPALHAAAPRLPWNGWPTFALGRGLAAP